MLRASNFVLHRGQRALTVLPVTMVKLWCAVRFRPMAELDVERLVLPSSRLLLMRDSGYKV